jgi:hypothetical protein
MLGCELEVTFRRFKTGTPFLLVSSARYILLYEVCVCVTQHGSTSDPHLRIHSPLPPIFCL